VASATSFSLSFSLFPPSLCYGCCRGVPFLFSCFRSSFVLTRGRLCHCLLRYGPALLHSCLVFFSPSAGSAGSAARARVFGSVLIPVCATSSWPFVFAAWGVPWGASLIAEEIAAQDELRGGRGLGQAQAQPPASWISLGQLSVACQVQQGTWGWV